MFEVGDWITLGKNKPWQATEEDVKKFRNDDDFKLWRPKKKDYIWDKDYGLAVVVSYDEEADNRLAIEIFNKKKHFTLVLKDCEPFIGELPSFLK